MGDSEAVLGLDGLKEGLEGPGEERSLGPGDKIRPSLSSCSSRGSQMEVKLPWYMGITCKDVKAILPTLVILFVGLLIMILVIPYAFSSVFKQLEMEKEINRIREEMNRNRTLAALEKTVN